MGDHLTLVCVNYGIKCYSYRVYLDIRIKLRKRMWRKSFYDEKKFEVLIPSVSQNRRTEETYLRHRPLISFSFLLNKKFTKLQRYLR